MGSVTATLEAVHGLSAVAIAAPLVLYPAWLAGLARLAPRPVHAAPSRASFGIVVAVRDEAETIRQKLEALLAQRGAERLRSLVVVDDGSTDETTREVELVRDARVVCVRSEGRGKSAAIATGLRRIEEEIVVLCDARQVLAPGTLEALLAPFADSTVGVVSCALETPDERGPGLYWRYERAIRTLESRTGSVIGATGALYAVRRSLVSAPPEGALLDDVLIPLRAAQGGARIVVAEDARVLDRESSLGGELARKARTIAGTWQLVAIAPSLLDPRKSPLWARFLLHKLARLVLPVSLAGLLVCDVALARESDWHAASAALQLGLWTIAALASLGAPLGRLGRATSAFAMLQVAAVLGAFRFLSRDLQWTQDRDRGAVRRPSRELALVRGLKRSLDVVAASAGLLLLSPLLAVISVAIFLEDRGPVIYRQRRALRVLGRDATGALVVEAFDMWKLRTMRVDAERTSGPVLAKEGDPRITRIGRLLRRTRLDEVPQLLHVLSGHMSLVGPRPERPELIARLADAIPLFEARARDVKPGITGLAQVRLRYAGEPPPGSTAHALFGTCSAEEDAMRTKLAFDMAYIASLTSLRGYLRTELSILLDTPLVMLRGLGR